MSIVLIAQLWTILLMTSLELDTWDAWTQPIFEHVHPTCGGGLYSMPWFVFR